MNPPLSRHPVLRLVFVHVACLPILVLLATALPKSYMETTSGRLVMILLADLMFAQFSLLGFWAVLGAGVWWRRMCHVAVAVIYIAAVSIPLDEVKYDSVFARFLTPLATSASITGVMILAFLIALRRRWRIGNASESVAEGRHPSQFSIFHLHALTTIVAILTAFFVSMASETNNGVVEVLVVNGFVIFVLMLTVISAVRASLGTASLLPRLCFVCVLAVVLGLIPSLALRASAELFIVWPLITTLPPLFVMASLLSLRASGTRLMVRPMLGSERT